MSGAEDDGVVFSSVRVALREAAAAAAGAKNASVWLTGTLGEKRAPIILQPEEDRWR